MNVRDACEPFFLYVCRLVRSGREAGADYHTARAELEAKIGEMRSSASQIPGIEVYIEDLELALIYFADSFIAESHLHFAHEWNEHRLAFDRGKRTGDDDFYQILDRFIQDNRDLAGECVAVLFTCLGLGFKGRYFDRPEFISNKMLQCSARMRQLMERDPAGRICPGAYKPVFEDDLTERPGGRIGLMAAILAISLVVVFVADWFIFDDWSSDLEDTLHQIVTTERADSVSETPLTE